MYPDLIAALTHPQCYPHPVSEIRVIETHISWVILTGDFAYKIKKPVNFGFLDFTSLEQRKHYCYEELRLNQRLAPDIYHSVVGFTGSASEPHFTAEGEAFEYAVKMHQFDESQRLDRLLQNSALTAEHIDALSQQIAGFHLNQPHASPDSLWGSPEIIWQVVSDNFRHSADNLKTSDDQTQLNQLSSQISQQFNSLKSTIQQRKREGHIRECHGDLHLANITLLHNEVRLFDCIEFNLEFRWIDTLCDLAFLLMDLEANQQQRFSHRCLNRYLEITGDYAGTRMLNFYKGYRAMVRAKVAMIGAQQDLDEYQRYLQLALNYANKPTPVLFLMHGVSGSGKSYLSQQLLEHCEAIRIRSDVERKRLHRKLGLLGQQPEMYGHEMNALTYNHLKSLTEQLLQAGESVIVDATFIRKRTRSSYIRLAGKLGIEVRIISCQCSQQVMEQRLQLRAQRGDDPSDADIPVMRQQNRGQQPLTEQERQISYRIDTTALEPSVQLLNLLRQDKLLNIALI